MPAEIFEKKNDLKHTLNSDDRIYKLIRDDHIQKSGKPKLRSKADRTKPKPFYFEINFNMKYLYSEKDNKRAERNKRKR